MCNSSIFYIWINFHFSDSPVWRGGSWHGTKMLWEQVFDVVVSVVSVVKSKVLLWVIVSGVSISTVGVAIEVNDWVVGVMFKLILLVISRVTISKLVRVFGNGIEHIHMFFINWIVLKLSEAIISGNGSKMLWEKIFDVVCCIVLVVE